MFQTFHLLPRTTALQNVELPLVYARVPRGEAAAAPPRRWRGSASRTAWATIPTSSRAASASASPSPAPWSTGPSILLADEPTGNLDSTTSEEIMALFDELSTAAATP